MGKLYQAIVQAIKHHAGAMLGISILLAPVYLAWSFLQFVPFLGTYFTFVNDNQVIIFSLAVMCYIWKYIKDFKILVFTFIGIYLVAQYYILPLLP